MVLSKSLLLGLLAGVTIGANQQPKQQGYLGFNSGATIDDSTPKQQSDFEAEFKTAQQLIDSPGLFNSVRLFTNIQASTDSDPISAFPAAIATNTSILLGVWCSGTDNIDNELKALNSAIEKYGSSFTSLVVGISVGSEDLYRISESGIQNNAGVGNTPANIAKFIKQVRSSLSGTPLKDIPVGHVDTWNAWYNSSNSAVVDAADFLGADIYPYYQKELNNSYSHATEIFTYDYNKTLAAANGKPVWITETGWPSTGPDFGDAEATLDNARSYWQDVGCQYFGRVNIWWYILRDSNPANDAKFAITEDLNTSPKFNLTCPTSSGAPSPINTNGNSTTESGGHGSMASGIRVPMGWVHGVVLFALVWWLN